MVRIALSAGLLLLAACTTPQPFRAGIEQAGPHGWTEYCARHAADPGCAGTNARQATSLATQDRAAGP